MINSSSEIRYANHGVFVGYLDHSQSIRVCHGDRLSTARAVEARRNFRKFCMTRAGKQLSPAFDPRFFTCLGSADDLVVGLLEDLPSFSQTASWSPELVTFTLCLAPTVESFCYSTDTEPLVPIEHLLTLSNDSHPLTVVIHLKLAGMVSLAFGGDLQLAAMEAICERIERAKQLFHCLDASSETLRWLSARSLDMLRFSILDPLAAEDIVAVMRCDNYAAASYLLTALRSLTLSDIAGCDSLSTKWSNTYRKKLLASSECVETAAVQKDFSYSVLGDETGTPILSQLRDNNLFISTYSTFAMGPAVADEETLFTPGLDNVKGCVSVIGFADVSPGHTLQAERQLSVLTGDQPDEQSNLAAQTNWRFVLPGRHDLLFSGRSVVDGTLFRPISTDVFFRNLSKGYGTTFDEELSRNSRESGLQDLTTYLAVAVPRKSSVSGDARAKLQSDCREFDKMFSPEPGTEHFDGMTSLMVSASRLRSRLRVDSPEELDAKLRDLGMSSASRSSVVLLFGEFCIAAEDPLLFDSVIDLYDAFIAISDYVCIAMPRLLNDIRPHSRSTTRYKHRALVIDAIEGLRSAFYLRTERAAAKKDDRDTRVQAKGSLNNLLACADTSVKCGIAILRYSMFPEQPNSPLARSKFCGVIAPQLNSKSTVQIGFLPKQDNTSVAVIHADAAHLFHPEHLVRLLHEVAHLFFESKVCRGPSDLPNHLLSLGSALDFSDDTIASTLFSWYSELYAEWFVNVFAFAGDFDTFLRATLLNFDALRGELQIDTVGLSRTDAPIEQHLALSLVDLLGRLYLMDYWHRKCWDVKLRKWNVPAWKSIAAGVRLEEFSQFVKYHAKATSIGKSMRPEEVASYTKAVAKARFEEFKFATSMICENVIRESDQYYKHVKVEDPAAIRSEVQQMLKDGIVLDTQSHDRLGEEFTIVFGIVAHYFRTLVGKDESGVRSIAKFDPIDGDFSWPTNKARQAHNQLYAITIKSLWQVSTRQRLRRLIAFSDIGESGKERAGA